MLPPSHCCLLPLHCRAKIAVRSLERIVRVNVLCNLGKVDAPAVLEPFPQHQALCLRQPSFH